MTTRILIVEDETEIRHSMRVALERDWLVPSIRALAGATVVGPGGHAYLVQGVELNLVSRCM